MYEIKQIEKNEEGKWVILMTIEGINGVVMKIIGEDSLPEDEFDMLEDTDNFDKNLEIIAQRIVEANT